MSFIDGDPDKPIITGRVYNGGSIVPHEIGDDVGKIPLCDEGDYTKGTGIKSTKTQSVVFRSCSTPGAKGYNEMRVEDKGGLGVHHAPRPTPLQRDRRP